MKDVFHDDILKPFPSSECTVGTCDFYDEVKNFLTCDNPTYAKGHGQPYCDKFDDAMDELDDKVGPRRSEPSLKGFHKRLMFQGKKWVMESRECEQRAIMKAVENHETRGVIQKTFRN